MKKRMRFVPTSPRAPSLATALVLALSAVVSAQAPATETRPAAAPTYVEPRATELLKEMSSLLGGTPRFAFQAEESFDEIPDGQPRTELTNVRRVAVERPNRLAADASGDTLSRAACYDGKTFGVLDKDHDTYATFDAPATIDATLDKLSNEYGMVLPLADLVYSDPYAILSAGVTYGRYAGIHLAAGVPCHHLVFAQRTIEWQIWIDAGAQPLPRQIVITYVNEPGEPQYRATFRKWNLDPKFPEGLFTFHAPEGARKVEPAAMIRRAPTAAAPSPGKKEPAQEGQR